MPYVVVSHADGRLGMMEGRVCFAFAHDTMFAALLPVGCVCFEDLREPGPALLPDLQLHLILMNREATVFFEEIEQHK